MTRRYAVLGHPVAHSRSPAIHTAAYRMLGLDAVYEARDVDGDGLVEAFDDLRSGELSGANVTMPHKGAATRLCDSLDPSAARSGSVNTLAASAGKVVGYSTDGAGVLHAWATGGLPTDASVLVLGTGGAARAAVRALAHRTDVAVAGRRLEAVDELSQLGSTPHPWGHPLPGAVVVNATPLGMGGERLPDGVIAAASGLLEMVYHPERTLAVLEAERLGIPVGRGLDMLVGQAAASFAIWFGLEPPIEEMRAAANPSSGS